MTFHLAGDTMLLVSFEAVIDPDVNARVIDLAAQLRAVAMPGVRDIVPGYCTLGVHFDPLRTDLGSLERTLRDGANQARSAPVPSTSRIHELVVIYGGADGPDLEDVAAFAGCSPDEVVARHAAVTYRVYMLGFVPGFAYLGRVDSAIAAPRRRVPRTSVPSGSVGIAGEQTGVYPVETPGGWQLIGRTDATLFDAAREPACLLAPGDQVRFVPR